VRREISSSTSQTTPSSSQTPLCSFWRCRPKSARFVAPPLPTKSCDFVGHPMFGTNCPEVLLSLRHLLPRVQPFSLQRGTVNDLLVGGHLFPDVELGHGENLVFVGNVLPPVVVFNEAAAIVQHISAGGVVSILVEPNIPPVCLVVEIVE